MRASLLGSRRTKSYRLASVSAVWLLLLAWNIPKLFDERWVRLGLMAAAAGTGAQFVFVAWMKDRARGMRVTRPSR